MRRKVTERAGRATANAWTATVTAKIRAKAAFPAAVSLSALVGTSPCKAVRLFELCANVGLLEEEPLLV